MLDTKQQLDKQTPLTISQLIWYFPWCQAHIPLTAWQKKLTTEKCKHPANQPEKKIIKIKIISQEMLEKNIILLKWMFV